MGDGHISQAAEWMSPRQHKAERSEQPGRSEQPDKASGPDRSCVDETSVKSPGMSHGRRCTGRTACIEPDRGDQSQSGGLLAQTSYRESGSMGSSDTQADNDQRRRQKKKVLTNGVEDVVAKGLRDESSC